MKQILLLCAAKPEWASLKKFLDFKKQEGPLPFFHAKTKHISITLVQIGIGIAQAKKSILSLLSIIPPPDEIIHFGVSGSLVPDLESGDVVIPSHVFFHTQQSLECHLALRQKLKEATLEAQLKVIEGDLLTSPFVLKTEQEKKEAHQKTKAFIVDMETHPVLQIFTTKNIPYAALRVIFDTLCVDLSNLDDAGMMDEMGNISTTKTLGTLVKKPKMIFELLPYRKLLSLCQIRLGLVLEKYLQKTSI
ncbi:MAG: hypothetical protein A3G32_02455 [Deltaproteobacteria bacterium RIFCSPLOWO2_12_FULL_40_28]|nr:MAG: hypothetical protein A3C45_03135 [Deltaproteobacteria bacterium RIFCSPHIGHO2_02_FULL_40_28]OGQ20688.1 MAG: hypothetical protein A3E27_10245 [Deltaproteobacteria bacterium RIFCSPHIGHO2_12_FULL_40_32]OGQ38923.1 MAG: hypothetical protein A3I69_08465 [Deltaproteobacteria bacterium RIFCSPLOWO2_02_FULL_40_36]OGQ55283.1 MAG: hypothetical protein A3G32_02455 [Deltaproteobacteria bacterium RIFCSPLOWO2_12_FULL_40_28]